MHMRGAIAAAAVLTAAAGTAAADTIDNLFGNTLLVSYPSGNQERFYFDADGAFRMIVHDDVEISAAWTRDGDNICITMEDLEPQCSAFPADKAPGESWEKAGENGETVRYQIVEGR
jgi:hypothetical protein